MNVHLRPVTKDNLGACLALRITPEQVSLVAPVANSLAEAYVDDNLRPYAVYAASARGYEQTEEPVIGFAVLQVAAGVGFVLRLILGTEHQGRGYGKATMLELMRKARLHPDVEVIATSHVRGNERMARLCANLGFVPWDIGYATPESTEVFLVHSAVL